MAAKSKEQLIEEAKELGIDVSEMNYQDMRSAVAEGHNKAKSEPRVQGEEGGDIKVGPHNIDEVADKIKVETLSLTASFKLRTREGDRIQYVFKSTGKTLKEAVESLECVAPEEEEGKDYPSDLNMLVNVKVKRGGYEFSRALAPHVSRACLGNRENIEYLELLLGLRK